MKRKIWLDCGAWKGTSTRLFTLMYPNAYKYDYYLFEPDTKICNEYLDSEQSHIHVYAKVIWTDDGYIDFHIGKHGRGSSVIKTKSTGKLDVAHPVVTPCIDFANFLKTNFDQNDYIVCKMNIEGAEYDVLQHLIKTDTLQYIKKLYICWHWSKIGTSENEHNKICNRVTTLVPTYGWDLTEDENLEVDNEHNKEWFTKTFTGADYE